MYTSKKYKASRFAKLKSKLKALPFVALCATGAPLLSVTTAVIAPTSAEAASCGACISAVNRQHRRTRNLISDEHDSTRETVQEEIRRQTLELIQALQRQTAEMGARTDRTVEAQRRISDAEQQNATFRQRQQFRAEAESGKFDPNPFICSILDMFRDDGSSGLPPAQGSQIVNQRSAYYSGNGRHADKVREGGVALAAALSDDRDRLAVALSDVSSYPTTDFSLIYRSPTIDLERPEIGEAIERQIANLFGPPPRPLSQEFLNTPQGKAESLERDRVMAVQHAAEQALAFTMNMRTPVKSSAAERRMFGEVYGEANIPDRISELHQLDMRVVDHYAMSDDRVTKLNAMNEKSLLNELIIQMSILNRMTYLQLEMEQRNATTLAAIAANSLPKTTNIRD